MYRKRQESRRRLAQRIVRWHPLILLMIMFLLGACSRQKPAAQPPANVPAQVQSTEAPTVPAAAETLHLIEAETGAEESLPPAAGITQAMMTKQQNHDWELDAGYCLKHGVCDRVIESMGEIL